MIYNLKHHAYYPNRKKSGKDIYLSVKFEQLNKYAISLPTNQLKIGPHLLRLLVGYPDSNWKWMTFLHPHLSF